MLNRMIRAIKLDPTLYEEVEADRTATTQAMVIVALVALVTGIAAADAGFAFVVWGILFGLLGWAAWASITYFVGTRLIPEQNTRADWGQMARGLGFAQSVGFLRVFGALPVIGWVVLLIVTIWQAAAMVIAVRQALDYTSTLRALAVVLIGGVPYVVLLLLIAGPEVD